MSEKKPPVVSLFSGVGGLDAGLAKAGFEVKLQIDVDEECVRSLRMNKQKYWPASRIIEGKVEDWLPKLRKAADLKVGEAALVCGGPPCQPFSKSAFWSPKRWANQERKGLSIGKPRSVPSFKGLEDPRAGLLNEFVRAVKEFRPKAFMMENVFGLAYKTSRPMLKALIKSLKAEGYTTTPEVRNARDGVLNAADYGVPQKRERLFVIGAKDGVKLRLPRPSHCSKDKVHLFPHRKPHVTAGKAIGALDDGKVNEDEKVGGKWGYLLPEVPPGDNYLYFTKKRGHPKPLFKWRSKYWSFLLKLSPQKPSWTIQAQPGPYVGPFHWRNRRLRVNEIKRLQTFPVGYEVWGDRRSAQRQLGDAVPYLLAKRIGKSVKQQLSEAGLLN